jgi:hypothetical protein
MNSVQFKDELINNYNDYNTIIHTSSEKDYAYLQEGLCIEIVNPNGDNVFVDLLDEIIIKCGNQQQVFDYFLYGDSYISNFMESLYYIDQFLNN